MTKEQQNCVYVPATDPPVNSFVGFVCLFLLICLFFINLMVFMVMVCPFPFVRPIAGVNGDWGCSQCDDVNFVRRTHCNKCGTAKEAEIIGPSPQKKVKD